MSKQKCLCFSPFDQDCRCSHPASGMYSEHPFQELCRLSIHSRHTFPPRYSGCHNSNLPHTSRLRFFRDYPPSHTAVPREHSKTAVVICHKQTHRAMRYSYLLNVIYLYFLHKHTQSLRKCRNLYCHHSLRCIRLCVT